MNIELNNFELIKYVNRQLENLLGQSDDIAPYLDETLIRVKRCFEVTNNKYYREGKQACFSHYHSGQYAIFLYYLANTIYRVGDNTLLATKIYYLNKILHSIDWYYEIELPEYFGVEHPLGSVLGRAQYNNGLFLYQGCTVGGNKGKYPVIGENVILYSNVTILGDSKIGGNVVISTGTTIKDENIPCNSLVFGQSPNLIIKIKDEEYINKLITKFWRSDIK